MIDTLFTRADLIIRLQQPPLGPHMEDLAASLKQQNYSDNTIRGYLRSAARFNIWLAENKFSLAEADENAVSRYTDSLKKAKVAGEQAAQFPDQVGGLTHLVKILRRNLVLAPAAPPVTASPTECERWLGYFDQYLERVIGAAPTTRDIYRRIVRRFAEERFSKGPLNWALITAEQVSQFVTTEAAKRKGFGRKVPAVAVRAALRFLVASGDLRDGLQAAVPTMRAWRHAALPRNLTKDQVDRVLADCSGNDPKALRNLAILLLLAKLGLRAKEVVRLELGAIDWKEGRLLIHTSKNHSERALPLSQEVGSALATYLMQGRPKSTSSRVFLTSQAPFEPLVGASAVSMVAKRALLRSGVPSGPLLGAHTFRHTVASEMVCRGVSFKEVADVLGHESLETTAIYAKLDLKALAQVALPWAGGVR